MESLARIEEGVRASDGEAILARWDFGQEVLRQRVGKQLPKGLLADICKRTGVGRQEVANRVRVAEHHDRVELSSELESSGTTWTALVKGLPKKGTTRKRRSTPKTEPTKETIAEANLVEKLVAKPAVAAELARRDSANKATRKAQRLAERAQVEQDQEAQHQQQVLRLRLIKGDTDWESLTEQYETMTDTVRRMNELLDGLPLPEGLRLKRVDGQLGQLQQELFTLRRRITPDYQEATGGEVWRQSTIEVTAR